MSGHRKRLLANARYHAKAARMMRGLGEPWSVAALRYHVAMAREFVSRASWLARRPTWERVS